jgi:hypothetical protein
MKNDHKTAHSLYFVFGGECTDMCHGTFRNPSDLEMVGIFSDYGAAVSAWRARAQSTVDNALMRYFIVPLKPPYGHEPSESQGS